MATTSAAGGPGARVVDRFASANPEDPPTTPTPVIKYENTYITEPENGEKFQRSRVRALLVEVLQEKMKKKNYDAEKAPDLAKDLSSLITTRVKALAWPRYKFVVQVTVTERTGQGVEIASRCLWDVQRDNYVAETFQNSTMIVMATVFGCYYD